MLTITGNNLFYFNDTEGTPKDAGAAGGRGRGLKRESWSTKIYISSIIRMKQRLLQFCYSAIAISVLNMIKEMYCI